MADSANSLVRITEIEGRGRAVVASRPVKAGEIILRDSPLLLYSANNTSDYCSNCFRNIVGMDPSSMLSCPCCSHGAVFCSPSCRSIALVSSHSPWVCQALASISSRSPSLDPDFQVQANFLVAAYNLAFQSPSHFELLLSLQGGGGSVDSQALALHSFISSLCPLPPAFPGFSPELTVALLAKDQQNAFGLMEPFNESSAERNVRAYAIYPKASFFNHDCLPNACRFDLVDSAGDHNTDITVRAIHDIPEGREICLSYFPVNWNYRDRQRRLMEDYGFACRCDRCMVEVKWKDNDDDDDDDDNMEQDEDDAMEGSENGHGAIGLDDFPHAYFFLHYYCDTQNCCGTLAPLPPSEGAPPEVKECNVCGRFCTKKQVDDDDDDDEEEDGVMGDD